MFSINICDKAYETTGKPLTSSNVDYNIPELPYEFLDYMSKK